MTNGGEARWSRAWLWGVAVAVLTGISFGVAVAPLGVAAAVTAGTAAVALVWRFGPMEGLWYLAMVLVPMRHPLAFDVRGTVSVFPTDLLLFGLVFLAAVHGRLKGLLGESTTLKIGVAVLLLSLPGLFTATHVFWGVAAIYRVALQLSAFAVAAAVVRDGAGARRTLAAVMVGLAPAALYGIYQSTFPADSPALPNWAVHLVAYGPDGTPNLRAFSTFDHALRFSHYLTVGFGVALGFVFARLSSVKRALAASFAALVAYANLFTYSIAGFLGMVAAAGSALFMVRRKRVVFLLLPILIVALLLASPTALVNKADRVLRGQATTGAARLVTYRQALNILRDHPLTGVGWGGIRSSLEYEYRLTRVQVVAYAAENFFLQRAMALGYPGLILFIWLMLLYFRNIAASAGAAPDWPRAALAVGGVAFFVQAQSFPAAAPESGILLWTLLALAERMKQSASLPVGGRS